MSGDSKLALAADLARPLLDSWWTVVAGVCFGLVVGLVGLHHAPKEFRATATVAAAGEGASAQRLRTAATDPRSVARLVGSVDSDRNAHDSPHSLRGRIRVARLRETGQYALSVGAGDPDEAAWLADRLVEILSASGEPFVLAERAAVPEQPLAPGAAEVWVWGLIVGLGLFVGPPLVRSAVNPVIRSPAAVRELTDRPLLASIPRVATVETREESRRRAIVNALLALLSVATLVVAVFALQVF